MTNSHGYVLEYPRIRVDHFDQAPVPLPASLLAHRRSIGKDAPDAGPDIDGLSFAPGQTHFDKPLLYLLTHIHTDHLKGLDRPGITAPIYCSAATKQLLLKYERQKTRIEKDRDGATTKHIGVVRPYAHLRVTDGHAIARAKLSGYQSTSLDLLHPLPYNVPTRVQYTPTTTVTLTLIESNHMFGGTMFLIQGAHGAVLHTGDMRAEEWWCDALTRNPFLSPYLCWSKQNGSAEGNDHIQSDNWADHIESLGSTTSSSMQNGDTSSQSQFESQSQDHQPSSAQARPASASRTKPDSRPSQLRLRNIYLDTELLLCHQKVPTKQQACLDMITLMRLYPSSTVFFLNCWTWGYEDMLIVTAKAFGCKIHVDRFKYIMYKAARSEAPFLADIITQDGSKTRFHACEKRNVCSAVQGLASRYSASMDPALAREAIAAHSQIDSSSPDARQRWGPPRKQPEPLLVYVNPGQISADRWLSIFEDTKQRLEAAQRHETAWPEAMVVPIERHSTLPELQNFVGLFRPRTVSPNTILDPKGGLDYYLLHHLFGHVLAAPDDRQKMVDEGLLMLGDKTWSFYETQLARSREQAQRRRNAGGGDSTEAVRAASASLNAESGGESIDAWQLERLSKLRGISFKGLMMQNMAGNLAAMLEIERWRRAAGIDEALEGLDGVIEESLGEMQSKTDASVSSVDHDADHSQFLETQVLPSRTASQKRDRIMHKDEGAEVSALPDAPGEAPHAGLRTPPQLPHISSAQSSHPAAAHDSQPEAEEDEPSTALTEHLASRYLNVLIHHFHVHFHRTTASYVDMWKTVRRTLPGEAQKVEEHWFRETGVLPPLWSSQVINHDQDADRDNRDVVELAEGGEESKEDVMGEILTSFIDMLDPAPVTDDIELVPVYTTHDRSIALQLILRHFAKLGFHDPVVESQGQSHASCADTTASEWKALSAPLSRLIKHLVSDLQSDISPSTHTEHQKHRLLSLQLAGILLSNRPLHTVIDTFSIQTLLECLIRIVEGAPSDYTSLDKGQRQQLALACAVLRAEELDEAVLAPFEGRLLALAQDANGPLMCEGWVGSESAEAFTQSVAQQPFESVEQQARSPMDRQGATAVDHQERGPMEESPSNVPIRQPRTPNSQPIPCASTSHLEADPKAETTDSILASATEHDTLDSSSFFAVVPVVEASQASSATQEEDSTQSEAESLPVLVRAVADGERRGMGRTASLPSFARGVGGVRKHGLEGDDTSRDHRRTKQ